MFLNVPVNIPQHFQPLDLTVNGLVKKFLTKKIEKWYVDEFRKEVNNNKSIDDIEVITTNSI